MRLLILWVISAIALILAALLAGTLGFDVDVDTSDPVQLMLGVGLLGILNATVGRIAKLLTLPLACLTFGIAWLLINAGLFYWVGQLGWGFHVGDFWSAVVGSAFMGIILGLLRGFVDKDDREKA